jgi:hypothetical protein
VRGATQQRFQVWPDAVSKIFPRFRETVHNMSDLEPQLRGLSIELEDRMQSAARGGAKYALGMVKAWHPEMRIHRVTRSMPQVTRSMPECDEHGKALDEQAILKSVRGYATRVAKHVDLSNSIVVYRIRLWFIEFDSGLSNSIVVYPIRLLFIEFVCGLSNSIVVYRIRFWFIKIDCGLSNSIEVVVYQIRLWFMPWAW